MSESIKTTRATVAIGALTVDAFMLPDGSYRMSQSGAAAAIADAPVYALRFLKTNDSKLLLGEAFTDYSPDVIEVESEPDVRGQTRINALPLEKEINHEPVNQSNPRYCGDRGISQKSGFF